MALKVWNGSSWVSATGLKVWNGSSWVTASNGKVWNGSAWTSFFANEIINITNHQVTVSRTAFNDGNSSAYARARLNSSGALQLLGSTAWSPSFNAQGTIDIDGTEYWSDTSEGSASPEVVPTNEWLQSGTPSLYSARATIVYGTTPNSNKIRTGTFGSWIALTSSTSWDLTAYSSTSSRANAINLQFTLDIALTSNLSNIIDSSTITLEAAAFTESGDLP